MTETPVRRRPRVAVVGGGVAGLTAALALRDVAEVTVLEATGAVGGKLRTSEVAGLPVDEGAESMVVRRPEGIALVEELGLGADLVNPAARASGIWSRGRLHPMPAGQVLGVPSDLRALARTGLLRPRELARVPLDGVLPRTRHDGFTTVGAFVARRLGRAVVDRLVEPLLGGIYAGSADGLALDAVLPDLAAALRAERSLLAAAAQVQSRTTGGGPVFGAVRGGMGRVVAELAVSSGATVRTSATVRELHRSPRGWRLVLGPASAPEAMEVDAVVLAVPASPAARLLREVAGAAALDLEAIDYASVAMVTLAYPRAAAASLPAGSGFLVPAVEGRLVKAVTVMSQKWGWLGDLAADLDDIVVVRLSTGRAGETSALQRDDVELAEQAAGDLADLTGVTGAPVDVRVTRWGGALPQYAPGHLARISRVRAAVAHLPGLDVCGAAYGGVGIPACIASGRAAAARIAVDLDRREQ